MTGSGAKKRLNLICRGSDSQQILTRFASKLGRISVVRIYSRQILLRIDFVSASVQPHLPS
jgi:hypothetical protein